MKYDPSRWQLSALPLLRRRQDPFPLLEELTDSNLPFRVAHVAATYPAHARTSYPVAAHVAAGIAVYTVGVHLVGFN